jgi:hypothetical protein
VSAYPKFTPVPIKDEAPLGLEWFEFMDMCSGGSIKEEPYDYIYLLAHDALEARDRFESLFNHAPEAIGCETCGENYSISGAKALSKLCGWKCKENDATLVEYINSPHVLVVWDIPPHAPASPSA